MTPFARDLSHTFSYFRLETEELLAGMSPKFKIAAESRKRSKQEAKRGPKKKSKTKAAQLVHARTKSVASRKAAAGQKAASATARQQKSRRIHAHEEGYEALKFKGGQVRTPDECRILLLAVYHHIVAWGDDVDVALMAVTDMFRMKLATLRRIYDHHRATGTLPDGNTKRGINQLSKAAKVKDAWLPRIEEVIQTEHQHHPERAHACLLCILRRWCNLFRAISEFCACAGRTSMVESSII